jgi:hypothetical protein
MTPSSVNSLSSTAFQLLSFVSQADLMPEKLFGEQIAVR